MITYVKRFSGMIKWVQSYTKYVLEIESEAWCRGSSSPTDDGRLSLVTESAGVLILLLFFLKVCRPQLLTPILWQRSGWCFRLSYCLWSTSHSDANLLLTTHSLLKGTPLLQTKEPSPSFLSLPIFHLSPLCWSLLACEALQLKLLLQPQSELSPV